MARGKSKEEIQTIAQEVFKQMREGKSTLQACKSIGIIHSTFCKWMNDDAELAHEYARAREDLHEVIAAEIVAIADQPVGSTESGATDTGAVQKQRLQVDTRKWLLSSSKYKPQHGPSLGSNRLAIRAHTVAVAPASLTLSLST